MNHAENRRVRANTQRQRQDRGRREAGILHQYSSGVAQVLPKFFKPAHAASVATPLLRLFHAAETFQRKLPRLFGIHPQPNVLLGLLFDVMAQFLVQLTLHLRFAKQRSYSCHQLAQHYDVLEMAYYSIHPNHSLCSAIIGSTLVARRAGIQQARSATPANSITTTTKVAGSVGPTPNSKRFITPVNQKAPSSPTATPISASLIPCPMTSLNTS